MYVCVCHGISDQRIREAVACGARSFEEVQACTGVATNCGACEHTARSVIDEHLDNTQTELQTA
jgi:bacterioferritin-associated ferredoxin